ncbi:MAG: DUF4097 family beta strand repeat protein [Lachnospiraceae bacterium]|nr:DUF4097 family beta strand repeat protein [Lachnospiraceae bacterium]
MKRRLKSLFRIAISFVTIGVIMITVGLIMGGAGELSKEVTELVHVMRVGISETVERIPLLERITNFSGFTIVVDVDKEGVSAEINDAYETMEGDYYNPVVADAGEVECLDISILNGVCRILPSENGCFGVESSDAEQYQCYVVENTLYLNALPKDWGKSEAAEIILYVPENQEYENVFLFCSGAGVVVDTALTGTEMDVSSICGDNIINADMDFKEMTMTAGIGTLSVKSLYTENLKLEVGTAEVVIENMTVGNMEANLGVGSILAQGSTNGDIVLNCGIGSLEMLLAGEQDSYNYDISGSAESVQIGTDTLAGMVMERWIDNNADKQITMSCAMGSVKIEFEE